MSAMPTSVFKLVELAKGQSNLARALNVKPQAVQQWVRSDRIPPERVLDACRVVDFAITPHELAPKFYPHPSDGVPEELRGRAAA